MFVLGEHKKIRQICNLPDFFYKIALKLFSNDFEFESTLDILVALH